MSADWMVDWAISNTMVASRRASPERTLPDRCATVSRAANPSIRTCWLVPRRSVMYQLRVHDRHDQIVTPQPVGHRDNLLYQRFPVVPVEGHLPQHVGDMAGQHGRHDRPGVRPATVYGRAAHARAPGDLGKCHPVHAVIDDAARRCPQDTTTGIRAVITH